MDALGNELEHLSGNVQPPDLGLRMALLQHAREPALAAADVQHALAGEIAEILQDQLYVKNARVNRGGKVFFVARGLIEGRADAVPQFRREPARRWLSG